MRDLLDKKIRLGDRVLMLSCGTGGIVTNQKVIVLSLHKTYVSVGDGSESIINVNPQNLLVI